MRKEWSKCAVGERHPCARRQGLWYENCVKKNNHHYVGSRVCGGKPDFYQSMNVKGRFRKEDQDIGGYSDKVYFKSVMKDFDELESDGMGITGTCI